MADTKKKAGSKAKSQKEQVVDDEKVEGDFFSEVIESSEVKKRIQELLRKREASASHMCEQTHTAPSSYWNLNRTYPSINTLRKYCIYLKVPLSDLLMTKKTSDSKEDLPKDQARLLQFYKTLPEELQDVVMDYVTDLCFNYLTTHNNGNIKTIQD